MDQTTTLPATMGRINTKDFLKSFEIENDLAIGTCPFCGQKEALHLKIGKHFFCTSCSIIGGSNELRALFHDDGYKKVRNRRRAENRKQTERNCEEYCFAPDEYYPINPYEIENIKYMLRGQRGNLERLGNDRLTEWFMERGISMYSVHEFGIGLYATQKNECQEEGVLMPKNIRFSTWAIRGLVFPNYRGKELIRYRVMTRNDSKSYPENLHPTPVVINALTPSSRIYFIVKNDLEALLLHRFSSGYNVVGLGEPGIKPDKELHYKL